jgi:hypothetical protein
VETLLGAPSRAKEMLGWTPTNPEVIAGARQK